MLFFFFPFCCRQGKRSFFSFFFVPYNSFLVTYHPLNGPRFRRESSVLFWSRTDRSHCPLGLCACRSQCIQRIRALMDKRVVSKLYYDPQGRTGKAGPLLLRDIALFLPPQTIGVSFYLLFHFHMFLSVCMSTYTSYLLPITWIAISHTRISLFHLYAPWYAWTSIHIIL